jgi:DUF1680 family protein
MSISDTSQSPHVTLRSLPLGTVKWTHGFWADRVQITRSRMIPTMGAMMHNDERVKFIGNFEVAAGLVDGRHRGPRWNDGDFYKWLEAACATLVERTGGRKSSSAAATGESRTPISQQIDDAIDLIRKAQREDGYIHTDIQIRVNSGERVEAFDNPLDFEMYNMGHLISAAIMHQRATGKTSLMEIAAKAADFLDRTFASPTEKQARHGICPSHLMALVELYRHTGNAKYRDLAKRLLEMRDLVTNGDDDNLDRVPFKQHTVAHGHAVRGTYLYSGAADIFAEVGEETIFTPLDKVWTDLTSRKLYITGGCGALFDGASPDGTADQKNITRVHQAFGRNYQLPNSTAHNETCAAIGNLMWNWRMLQITGDGKFGDLVEHTLYNSVLAGVSLDGEKFFYTNTLRQLDPMPVELRWNRQRQKVLGCYCCPPNVARTLAELSHYAYLVKDDSVAAVLYGSNRLETTLANGARVAIEQETSYPWDGRVMLKILHDGQYAIALRIPAWSESSQVCVNGQRLASETVERGFIRFTRNWRAGDAVELNLDVAPTIVEANPLVEESLNQLAVLAGPVVYCLESKDLPAGARVMEMSLSRSTRFAPRMGADELQGIRILDCELQRRSSDAWAGRLYRKSGEVHRQPVKTSLIPYFAWDNRGESEMTVWIPARD